MRYVTIGWSLSLPADFLSCYPSRKRPSLSDIQELTGKGRLHTTDDDIVLLVRNMTPPLTTSSEPSSVGRAACLLNDEPIRIYVPLLVRPWIMQACHSTASCHLGTTRTLRMLEVLLVDRHECLHPVVASPLLKVPSAEEPAADCPLANHLPASPGRSWCRH